MSERSPLASAGMSHAIHSLLATAAGRSASAPSGPMQPALRLAVLTCMDARIDPLAALGIGVGDAHVLRNAGGRVTDDVVRSLALSTHSLGVAEVGIVQHTGCGLEGVGNDTLARETGLVGVDFLPFDQVDDSVAADVDRLLAAGALPPGTAVWGGVYDLADGRIRLVREPSPAG